MTTFRAAVTYEFSTNGPLTLRPEGGVQAASWPTAAARAIKATRALIHKQRPRSVVVVLERQEESDGQ